MNIPDDLQNDIVTKEFKMISAVYLMLPLYGNKYKSVDMLKNEDEILREDGQLGYKIQEFSKTTAQETMYDVLLLTVWKGKFVQITNAGSDIDSLRKSTKELTREFNMVLCPTVQQ